MSGHRGDEDHGETVLRHASSVTGPHMAVFGCLAHDTGRLSPEKLITDSGGGKIPMAKVLDALV